MLAARKGHTATAAELARLGADINAKDVVRACFLQLCIRAAASCAFVSPCG
jgi:hypothetical protein